jgi:hypothetical protein
MNSMDKLHCKKISSKLWPPHSNLLDICVRHFRQIDNKFWFVRKVRFWESRTVGCRSRIFLHCLKHSHYVANLCCNTVIRELMSKQILGSFKTLNTICGNFIDCNDAERSITMRLRRAAKLEIQLIVEWQL